MGNKFKRSEDLFSLCGLNCGLCPMHIRGGCSGCFTDSPCYPSCPIAPCSVRHGSVEYCYQCKEYPCKRYDGIDLHDSLISHRNQKKDLVKAKEIGIDAYLEEQRGKVKLLHYLLDHYDEGDKDVFFCLAVNMLPLDKLKVVIDEADQRTQEMGLAKKELYMVGKLYDCADAFGIVLELRR